MPLWFHSANSHTIFSFTLSRSFMLFPPGRAILPVLVQPAPVAYSIKPGGKQAQNK